MASLGERIREMWWTHTPECNEQSQKYRYTQPRKRGSNRMPGKKNKSVKECIL